MKIIIAFCFLCISVAASAQVTFQRNFRNSSPIYLWTATKSGDNGYIYAGQRWLATGVVNTYVVKTDSLGNQQWSKIFEPSGQFGSWAYDILPIHGGYAITGASNGSNNTWVFLLKIDDTGRIEWSKEYGSSMGTAWGKRVRQTGDGGFIILGDAVGGSNGISNNGVYLIKTDSIGNIEWSRTYNTLGEWGSFIENTANHSYLIGGYSLYANPSLARGFLMSVDSVGNLNWAKSYSNNISLSIGRHVKLADGTHIFGGTLGNGNTYAPFILKMDSLYNPIWAKQYNNTPHDVFNALIEANDFGYVLLASGTGTMVLKTDSMGTIQWVKSTVGDYAVYVKQLADTGYILLGYSSDSLSGTSFSFIKTDSLGNSCFSSIITPTVMNFPITVDTFSFYIGSIDSMRTVTFTATSNGYDTLICSQQLSTIIASTPESQNVLSVFPNPTNSIITFQTKNTIRSIEVYDMIGRIVLRKNHNFGSLSIDLQNEPKGIYFYKIQLGDGIQTGRFLLQ
ncbi:MAG: T9SS type A sorting domain-containing protein [Bacteroidetes bacterium]|nr:T9SS type A sorting domain-containing protein [Bacteroidota bacterium]